MNSSARTLVEEYSSRIEDDRIFFAPNVPPKKLKNALGSYASAAKDEEVLVLIDDTIFGSAKDGALLTSKGFYVHGMMQSPQSIQLSDIQSVTLLNKKLHINNVEFLSFSVPGKEAMRLFAEMLIKISGGEVAQPSVGEQSIAALRISNDMRDILEEYSSIIEDDHVFFAPSLPPKKVKNAQRSYANLAKDEEPLALIDDTTLGSAKAGVLLTDKSIYSHIKMESPQRFELRTIQRVTFKKGILYSIIHINDTKFAECSEPSKEAVRLFAEMVDKISRASDDQDLRRFSVVLLAWEQWDDYRAGHLLGGFKGGCANVARMFMFTGLFGILVGCVTMLAPELDTGAMEGLGMIALFWTPYLVWAVLTALYKGIIRSKEEKKQLGILLNNPLPGKRCNAAYMLSVIGAKGAIPHLESLLNDDTIDPTLREYVEKSLAKLKE